MAYLPRQGGASWIGDEGGSTIFDAAANLLNRNKFWIGGALAAVGAVKIYGIIKKKKLRAAWDTAGQDVVVLHTMPPGRFCPSVIPASLKLETFFRLAKIQYKFDYEVPMGPKNKMPWVTVNGVDIADSEIIIEKLQKMFNKFPDSDLPAVERAVGVAMRVMLEEHFYWGLVSWRYAEDNLRGLFKVYKMPVSFMLLIKLYQSSVGKTLYIQGIGRHTFDEVHQFMKKDLEAISLYLGSKQFFHGDALSVVDCAIFGFLCQLVYNCPDCPYEKYIREDLPNLVSYVERVKERLWPDWEACIGEAPAKA